MSTVIVQYKVHPASVEENERLIRAVYSQLHETKPDGFRYTTSKLDDGQTFVHFAILDEGATNPLATLPAFKDFQSGIKDRCVEPPIARNGAPVGSFGIEI